MNLRSEIPKMNVLISACLMGMQCRYDGQAIEYDGIKELGEKYQLIPFCPEIYGGLATPRNPAEIRGEAVITDKGQDVTREYHKGAQEALKLARMMNCKYAILKERSPSCGHGKIYDGTFSGTQIDGSGMTAKLLSENGITIFGETQMKKLMDDAMND